MSVLESVDQSHFLEVTGLQSGRFKVYEMAKHYDEELLKHFYETIMKSYFPLEDELDPLEEWIYAMKFKNDRHLFRTEMYVDLLMDMDKWNKDDPKSRLDACIGGSVYEYYKISNCGLLSYFVVKKEYNGMGLGHFLVKHSFSKCKEIARQFLDQSFRENFITDHITELYRYVVRRMKKLNGNSDTVKNMDFSLHLLMYIAPFLFRYESRNNFFIFLAETNAIGVDDGVLDSSVRHSVLRKYGFRLLDFDYIQPPLGEDQQPCPDLLLLALDNEDIPKHNGMKYIPSMSMILFIVEFAYSISSCISVETFAQQPYYKHVIQDLMKKGDKLYLNENQWTRRTMFPPTSSKL